MGSITFKAIRAAIIGGALTGAGDALAHGTTKSLWAAAGAGALAAVIHLFQDNPLKADKATP
jgi:hypothetical protein